MWLHVRILDGFKSVKAARLHVVASSYWNRYYWLKEIIIVHERFQLSVSILVIEKHFLSFCVSLANFVICMFRLNWKKTTSTTIRSATFQHFEQVFSLFNKEYCFAKAYKCCLTNCQTFKLKRFRLKHSFFIDENHSTTR